MCTHLLYKLAALPFIELQDAECIHRSHMITDLYEVDRVDGEVMDLPGLAMFCHGSDYDYAYSH